MTRKKRPEKERCPWCHEEKSPSGFKTHVKFCKDNPEREKNLEIWKETGKTFMNKDFLDKCLKLSNETHTLMRSLGNRKWCTRKCPIYPCSLMSLDLREEGKRLCAIQQLPEAVKKTYFRLMMKGEEGLILEWTDAIVQIHNEALSSEDRLSALKAYTQELQKFKELVYGKHTKIDVRKLEIKAEVKLEDLVREFGKGKGFVDI